MSKSPDNLRRTRLQRLGYDLFRIVARLIGVVVFRLRCEGRPHYPTQGGGLVCSNHQSFLDPVLVGLTCDRRLNYLARASLFDAQPLRSLIQFLDAIPIDRDGLGLAGLKETLRRLRQGEFVLIFPEGTRTGDGNVRPLKPGFCAVARRGRVPLIPVGIAGAFEAWPRKEKLPRPAPIRVVIGQPIKPEEFETWTDNQLVAELEQRIRDCHARAARDINVSRCRPSWA